jgi:hypothetical protein
MGNHQMTMLLGHEKLPISEPLARLDGQWEKRSDRLIELEIADRVPARFARIAVTSGDRADATQRVKGAESTVFRPARAGVGVS